MTALLPILDSHFPFDPMLLPAVRQAPAEAARLLGAPELPGEISLPVWCYLTLAGEALGLVDTGSGALFGEADGRLEARLLREGVSPDQIRRVWLTHLHGDHCGGLVRRDGEPVFPNARIAVPAREVEFWLDRAHEDTAADIARDARAALRPYGGRLDHVSPGDIVDGAEAIAAPGHTPGHLAWRLPAQNALAAGDILHVPALQLAHLDWSSDWDWDAALATQSRKALIDAARTEGQSLLTGHGGVFSPACLSHIPRSERA